MSDTPITDAIPRNGSFHHYRVDDVLAACRKLERERDAAIALNQQYHSTRQDTRNFAKNAQDQRDDWQKEAQSLGAEVTRLRGELTTVIFLPEDWKEIPSCEVLGDGKIRVSWKTLAELMQKHKNQAYAESDRLKIALTAITRNQSEKEGQEGICPFGCDAPWIAMSTLGLWKDKKVEAWKP